MTVGNAYFYGERKFFEEFTLFLSNYDNINLTVTGKLDGEKHVGLSGNDVIVKSTITKYNNQDALNQIAAIRVGVVRRLQ